MNQKQLNKYFATKWKNNLDQYTYSGWELINKVKKNEWVLDVGCGPNLFKGKISNLIGIDPAFEQADYKVTIKKFKTSQKFDVAFCLGSINFGSEDKIISEINSLVKLLKPSARIYWRCNPGRKDHENKDCEQIDFFSWTFELHEKFSNHFGFECIDLKWDNNHRIYSEWIN